MKIIFWLLVAVGVVYAFYSGAMAVWSYLEVQGVVEEAVKERAAKSDRFERAPRVKEDIIKKATTSGIKVDDREVFVTDDGRTLAILVRWTWPVIVYQGEEVLAIPLKHARTFDVPEKR